MVELGSGRSDVTGSSSLVNDGKCHAIYAAVVLGVKCGVEDERVVGPLTAGHDGVQGLSSGDGSGITKHECVERLGNMGSEEVAGPSTAGHDGMRGLDGVRVEEVDEQSHT